MGCYDTVLVKCPVCGVVNDFQSKGGECLMRSFTLLDCPDDVFSDVNRHSPTECLGCKSFFYVDTNLRKGVVFSGKLDITKSYPGQFDKEYGNLIDSGRVRVDISPIETCESTLFALDHIENENDMVNLTVFELKQLLRLVIDLVKKSRVG